MVYTHFYSFAQNDRKHSNFNRITVYGSYICYTKQTPTNTKIKGDRIGRLYFPVSFNAKK